jgi:hypothetical protein
VVKFVIVVAFLYSFANYQGWVYALTKPGRAFHDTAGFSLGAPKADPTK